MTETMVIVKNLRTGEKWYCQDTAAAIRRVNYYRNALATSGADVTVGQVVLIMDKYYPEVVGAFMTTKWVVDSETTVTDFKFMHREMSQI